LFHKKKNTASWVGVQIGCAVLVLLIEPWTRGSCSCIHSPRDMLAIPHPVKAVPLLGGFCLPQAHRMVAHKCQLSFNDNTNTTTTPHYFSKCRPSMVSHHEKSSVVTVVCCVVSVVCPVFGRRLALVGHHTLRVCHSACISKDLLTVTLPHYVTYSLFICLWSPGLYFALYNMPQSQQYILAMVVTDIFFYMCI